MNVTNSARANLFKFDTDDKLGYAKY
jgi:hypothetical protein